MIEPHYDDGGQLEEDSNLLGGDELPPHLTNTWRSDTGLRSDHLPFPYSNPGQIRSRSGAKNRHREGLATILSQLSLKRDTEVGFVK